MNFRTELGTLELVRKYGSLVYPSTDACFACSGFRVSWSKQQQSTGHAFLSKDRDSQASIQYDANMLGHVVEEQQSTGHAITSEDRDPQASSTTPAC